MNPFWSRLQRLSTILLVLEACSAPVHAPGGKPAAERGTFVLHTDLGPMTERFARTPERLEVERTGPNGARQAWSMALQPDASVVRLEVRSFAPGSMPNAPPVQRSLLVLRDDSTIAEVGQGDSVRVATRRGRARNAMPYLYPSVAALEQLIRRARALGGSEAHPVQLPLVHAWGIYEGAEAATVRFGPDSAFVAFDQAYTTRVRTDAAGRVLSGIMPEALGPDRRIERVP